jgi:hypothetical protein
MIAPAPAPAPAPVPATKPAPLPAPAAVVILPGTGAAGPVYVEIVAPLRPRSGASPWSP